MEWFGPWERGEISNLGSSVYKYYTSTIQALIQELIIHASNWFGAGQCQKDGTYQCGYLDIRNHGEDCALSSEQLKAPKPCIIIPILWKMRDHLGLNVLQAWLVVTMEWGISYIWAHVLYLKWGLKRVYGFEQLWDMRTYSWNFNVPYCFWIDPCGGVCFVPTHSLSTQMIDDLKDCVPLQGVVEVILLGDPSASYECLEVGEWVNIRIWLIIYIQSLSCGSVIL